MANDLFGACGGVLQGSHINPQGAWPLLALYPLNVKILCRHHHKHIWPNRHDEMVAWMERRLGRAWMERLHQERLNHLARKGMTAEQLRAEWKSYGLGDAQRA